MTDPERIHPITAAIRTLPEFIRTEEALQKKKGPVAAFGLQETHRAHLAAALGTASTVLYVCSTDTGALQVYGEISCLLKETALFLPRETPLTHVMNASSERSAQRLEAMLRLLFKKNGVVVCSAAALMQRLAPTEAFLQNCVRVRTGDGLDPRGLMAKLTEAGYERVELVEGRGQAASRGDLVDVYPPQERYPLRVEFWGDNIDQMRRFDPVTQRSVEQCTEALLPPAYETPQTREAMARALSMLVGCEGFETQTDAWEAGYACSGADTLLPLLYEKTAVLTDYLPPQSVILAEEPVRLEEAVKTAGIIFSENVTAVLERGEGHPLQAQLQISPEETMELLSTPKTFVMYALSRSHPKFAPKEISQFIFSPTPQYMGNTRELARDIASWKKKREAVVLYAGGAAKYLKDRLLDEGMETSEAETLTRLPARGEVIVTGDEMVSGFVCPELHLTVLGGNELNGKTAPAKKAGKKRNALSFSELAVGDYVVHEAHGIGRFTGVESLTVDGNTRDYLLIEYRGGDRLYIPTDQLDRVQKYVGGGDEDAVPHLSKLGGNEWQGRVNKARDSAKKLAVDLAALYAARAGEDGGFAFSKDSAWQVQMEERFPYTETPDQLESIKEIKLDMEKKRPMDRLLCGDVGYGKTEVAMRAAFKAVQDSKQVAFLVPTTVLAQQHYNTVTARLADFPVRVACLSRFQTPQQRTEIKKRLAAGEIDILIGTHALLAKDVVFKDLGLLIIDEEHRFGVNHKEKIKDIKKQVDVLTLTATPIPRTLNLSLSGIRDISVIETPPEDRFPVQTYVLEYSDGLVKDAISKEVARGGQVYVVSNRVQNMEAISEHIRELLPEVSVLIGHGQMNENLLEKTMLDFMEHKADVLLCSTIIESGLDIPNANTMIILDADKLGLAQLYQLRGRVGRSNRLGYAYLTVPRGREMNEKAQKRLMAIREFTQFGAGFQLAMRDLEIRGAGSLLGAEQHGHIMDVGYEYYLKIVRDAVSEAKGETVQPEPEVTLDIPLDAHIPKDYIPSELQRLAVYRKIAEVSDAEAADLLREELEDRYGEVPATVENLLLIEHIKHAAGTAMINRVTVQEGEALMNFAEGVMIDGVKLIFAVSSEAGARLIASEPPAVRIMRKKESVESIATMLPQFLSNIAHCIDKTEAL